MERNVTFDLLHDLVNMAVQHGHRTETFDVRQGLLAVVGSPAPIWIDGPQRNVRKENNRRTGRAALEIVLKPLQLFVSQRTHTSGLQIGDIYQPHEMNALLIEAIPPTALGTLPVTLEKLFAVVAQHVMLTRHIVDLLRRRTLQYLVQRIELARLR